MLDLKGRRTNLMVLNPSTTVLREVLAQGGLFHCTSVPALRLILRDGHLRPAQETGAPARGAGVASRCRRLGGVCLFDVLPQSKGARTPGSNPGRTWCGVWLKSYELVTVAVHLDQARLLAHGGTLLTEAQARRRAKGVMLRGEVCHLGALPLAACALGFLFVRRHVKGGEGRVSYYVPGSHLTPADLRCALGCLRRLAHRQEPCSAA